MEKLSKVIGSQGVEALVSLYEDIPGVLFWVKDYDLRILELNQAFAERVNLPRSDILGKTDADLYFPELASVFMADDRQVMASGEPMRRKVELLANRFGGVEWRSTTKRPLLDSRGKVVGTTGVSCPLAGSAELLPGPYRAFGRMIEYCREHLASGVSVEDLAGSAGMSLSTLSRRFREHLRLSPGEFLAQLRISRACQLLAETPLNITEIALECGYESPAAFSRAFRKQMQRTPMAYRQASA